MLFLKYLSQCKTNLLERLVYNPTEGDMNRLESTDVIRGKIRNIDEILNLPFVLQMKAQEELFKLVQQMEKENQNAVA